MLCVTGCVSSLRHVSLEPEGQSEELRATNAAALAAGVPAQDVAEIEKGLSEIRETSPEAHTELTAQWQEAVFNLENSSPVSRPRLRRLFVAGLKRRLGELTADSADTAPAKPKPKSQDRADLEALAQENKTTAQSVTANRPPSRPEKSTEEHAQDARVVEAEGKASAAKQKNWFFNKPAEGETESRHARRDKTPAPRARDSRKQSEFARRSQESRKPPVRPASYEQTIRPKNIRSDFRTYPSRSEFVRSGSLVSAAEDRVVDREQSAAIAQSVANEHWRDRLSGAIAGLEAELESGENADHAFRNEAILRLLYLADGQHDAAVEPVSAATDEEREFWAHEMYGLSILLDEGRKASIPRRATEAVAELREANEQLSSLGDLVINNMTFCRAVSTFGIYEEFGEFEFAPGQATLVYIELDNFRSEDTSKGKRLSFAGSYQILDSYGRILVDRELAKYEERAQRPRRDFFLHYRIAMPPAAQIGPGEYTLQLSVVDNVGQQTALSRVDFKIAESAKAGR